MEQIPTSHILGAKSHLWPVMTTSDNVDIVFLLGLLSWVWNKVDQVKKDTGETSGPQNYRVCPAAMSGGSESALEQVQSGFEGPHGGKISGSPCCQLGVFVLGQRDR